MLGPLFFFSPLAYTALRAAAAIRHDLCGPFLGTHANDAVMQIMYPIDPIRAMFWMNISRRF
jgi:hypothetical protein